MKKAKDGEDPEYLTQPSMKEASSILADLVLLEKGQITLANDSEGKTVPKN